MLQGILVVAALSGGCTTFFFGQKMPPPYRIAIILSCALVLRLIPSLDPNLHEWDERFHALVAKNMQENLLKPTLYINPVLPYDYQNWTANHLWLHKQPLSLWIIHFSIKIFGLNALAVRLPSIILSVLCVFFTYLIAGLLLKDEGIALFAAFLQAINGFLIENASGRVATDHIDCHFLFFTELCVLLICLHWKYLKNWMLILIGIALGLAILTKWLTALFVVPLFASLHYAKMPLSRNFFSCLFICLLAGIIAAPWQFYIFHHFPLEARWEQQFNFRHVFEPIEAHSGAWYFHLLKARIIWNELIYVPVLFLFYKMAASKKSELLFLVLWIVIPYVFFSLVQTKMKGYVMLSAPALFIASAYFMEQIRPFKFSKLFTLLFVGLAIRYSIERIKPFQDPESFEAITLIEKVKKISGKHKVLLFNFPYPIEAMFFTNCTAYGKLPSIEELLKLQQDGYSILVYDQQLPEEYKNITGIELFK